MVATCVVLLRDGGVEVEDGVSSHDVELSRYQVSLLRPLVGEGSHAHLAGLHIELQHEFLHVLIEVSHALFYLCVGEGKLRLCLPHLSPAPSPVEDGQCDGDACRFLAHGVPVGSTNVGTRLRESKLHIEFRLQPCVGAGLCQTALALLLDAAVIVGIGTVRQRQFHRPLHRHIEVGHLQWNLQSDFLRLSQSQEGTDGLHLLPQRHLGIHYLGLLVQSVDFQLQHFVLRDSSVGVTPPCHLVERVCRGEVLPCHLPLRLCRCQVEEILASSG